MKPSMIAPQTLGKRMNPGFQKNILALLIALLIPASLFGFDFQDVRKSLKSDLLASNGKPMKTTIAVVYNNKNRNKVKKQINLVQFKKELSAELVRSFNVVDPILGAKVQKLNKITYESLLTDSAYLQGFSSRTESTHVLFVDMLPQERQLVVNMQLLTAQGEKISKVHIEIPLQKAAAPSKQEPEAFNNDESLLDKLRDQFTASPFVDGHNESYIFFTPTAYVQPEKNAVDILAWIKDLRNVEFVWMRLRYDMQFAERFQIGIQSNAIAEKRGTDDAPNDKRKVGHHSTYGSIKYLIMDEEQFPVSFSLGVKGRLLWDNGNTDFETGDQGLDDKNDKQNELTLFTALSGKFDDLGLLVNFYLDSQQFGTGVKFLMTPDIKLFFDSVFYYYDEAKVSDDQAVGVQFYGTPKTSLSFSYQYQTKQAQMGVNVNW